MIGRHFIPHVARQSFEFATLITFAARALGVIGTSSFMVSACCWRGRLCFGRGRDRGFVLYISLFFVGVRVVGVCVLVYARTHTQTDAFCI